MSNRLKMWEEFNERMIRHIENYTVPQYGDWPDDQLTEFTPEDIVKHMKRYLNRSNSNQRGAEESIRDCLKLAHYACELWIRKGGSNKYGTSVKSV